MDEMFVIEADRRGETTRFVVGCAEQSERVETALRRADYRIRSVEFTEPPDRTETETNRATRILGELFGN